MFRLRLELSSNAVPDSKECHASLLARISMPIRGGKGVLLEVTEEVVPCSYRPQNHAQWNGSEHDEQA